MYQFLIQHENGMNEVTVRIELLNQDLFKNGNKCVQQTVKGLYTEVSLGCNSVLLFCEKQFTVVFSYEDIEEGNVLLDLLISQFLSVGYEIRMLHLSNFQPLRKLGKTNLDVG
ncbi:hypothetical protein [Alkalihalobacillus sp. AL-G]|uniref:hypothetical protein n=1 Tax=Alkalihalobacillus sp. AL-G TaxID=2926399 RepID=UPI00272B015D|nr:hypothetical protein [Alkalihalobacillus sp. AL-G]WLD92083.1 hypothetical protein MOJ78_13715 [Alkalihalobacillus sp. AL-G]